MATTNRSMPLLGSIHCQYCGELIDTLDTERVTVYYGICSEPSCRTAGNLDKESHEHSSDQAKNWQC